MGADEFVDLIADIPKPTKGTHPIEANKTERVANIPRAHCAMKGEPKKSIVLVDMKDVLAGVKFMIAGSGLKEDSIKDGATKVSAIRKLFGFPIDKFNASGQGQKFSDPAILEVSAASRSPTC